MDTVRNNMLAVGVEDLNLRGTHILLAMDSTHQLVTGENGFPEIRIGNFEFLRRMNL